MPGVVRSEGSIDVSSVKGGMNDSLRAVSFLMQHWLNVRKEWIWGQEDLMNRL